MHSRFGVFSSGPTLGGKPAQSGFFRPRFYVPVGGNVGVGSAGLSYIVPGAGGVQWKPPYAGDTGGNMWRFLR